MDMSIWGILLINWEEVFSFVLDAHFKQIEFKLLKMIFISAAILYF